MRIGVDLGGTKVEGIALAVDGAPLFRERIPTPQGDYHATLQAISGLIDRIERETGAKGSIGIGIPGTISADSGLVKNANSTWLIGKPLHSDLEALLSREIRIANDADCFALSEATDGAGAQYRSVFGVILGTGVGGGLVIDGKLQSGPNGIAGEWGHNRLGELISDPEPVCYCGRSGCIETYLSGPGLSRDHALRTGVELSAEDISAAAGYDNEAEDTLQRYERRLAAALSQVINIVDPDVIILGGGLSRMTRLYDTVPALLPGFVFSDTVATTILPPQHGDSSGVRGAAWLWPPQ